MVTNPATILFDVNGNPHAVVDGYVVTAETPSLLVAGVDNGVALNIGVTEDRAVKVKDIRLEKTVRYSVTTNVIYIGYAAPGSADSGSFWKIYRILLDVDGNPTEKKISADNVIWDNRTSIVYS